MSLPKVIERTPSSGKPGIPGFPRVPPRYAPQTHSTGRREQPEVITHIGAKSEQVIARAVAQAGECAVSVGIASDGTPRALAFLPTGGSCHLLSLQTVDSFGELAGVLQRVPFASFGPLPSALTERLGLAGKPMFDVELAAQILLAGERNWRSLSIIDLVQQFGLEAHLEHASQTVSQCPRANELRALATHAAATSALARILRRAISAEGLEETLELELAVRPIIEGIGRAGIRVDAEGWAAMVASKQVRAFYLWQAARERLGIKNVDDTGALLDRLKRAGYPTDSIATGDLVAAMHDIRGLEEFVLYRQVRAFLTGPAQSVMASLERSSDERVHAAWDSLGSTGRITASRPALLSMPAEYEVRRQFVPEPGHVFIVADYSASQLRILAEHVGDDRLIEVFRRDRDPHRATAAIILGCKEDAITPEQRDAGKAINFGIVFGMTQRGLLGSAMTQYGLALVPQGASLATHRLLAVSPQIARWQAKVRRALPLTTRSLSGRIRRFDRFDTNPGPRLASPIQATEADAIKHSLIAMAHTLAKLGGRIVLVHYDSVIVEAPESAASEARAAVVGAMAQGMRRYLRKVPVKVEAEVRKSWATEKQIEQCTACAQRDTAAE